MEEEAPPWLSMNKLRNKFGVEVGESMDIDLTIQTACIYSVVCLQCQKP
jgi:hypothetical protein